MEIRVKEKSLSLLLATQPRALVRKSFTFVSVTISVCYLLCEFLFRN